MVVRNRQLRPQRKRISAIFSQSRLLRKLPLIDMKERIQLDIKKIVVPVVISSIKVASDNFNNFKEVSTTKQSPNKLEEALSI